MTGRTARRTLQEAHLPTWFKAALHEASNQRRTYADIGVHLGKGLEQFSDDTHDPMNVLAELDDTNDVQEWLARPTVHLRRLFVSEEHPRADLVDYIPQKRRRELLKGILIGAEIVDPEDPERVTHPKPAWRGRGSKRKK